MSNNQQIYNVKPFDGSGFSNWEFRMKLILEQAKVLSVLIDVPPTGAEQQEQLAAFNTRDVKAKNLIVQGLDDNMLEMIKVKLHQRK